MNNAHCDPKLAGKHVIQYVLFQLAKNSSSLLCTRFIRISNFVWVGFAPLHSTLRFLLLFGGKSRFPPTSLRARTRVSTSMKKAFLSFHSAMRGKCGKSQLLCVQPRGKLAELSQRAPLNVNFKSYECLFEYNLLHFPIDKNNPRNSKCTEQILAIIKINQICYINRIRIEILSMGARAVSNS